MSPSRSLRQRSSRSRGAQECQVQDILCVRPTLYIGAKRKYTIFVRAQDGGRYREYCGRHRRDFIKCLAPTYLGDFALKEKISANGVSTALEICSFPTATTAR